MQGPSEQGREYQGERDMGRFWRVAAGAREPMTTRGYPLGLLVCLLLSVPFYFSEPVAVIMGLPLWVWSTLFWSLGLSSLTAFYALRHWDDGPARSDARQDTSGS